MTRQYTLKLIIEDTDEQITISGEFEDDEWKLLEEFLLYVEELAATKFVRDGMPSSLRIRGSSNGGATISSQLPSWDDVSVFLHKFRPIGLRSERTNFYKIHNLLARRIKHPHFRNFIKVQHEAYSGKRSQAQMQIAIDENIINSEEMFRRNG